MNDKAHMQTQNGFITLLNMLVFHLYVKEILCIIRETGYEEDIKRREGWKMNVNRKSDTPLGTSHPLNYY